MSPNILVILMILAMVIAHELGHVLAALLQGKRVTGVYLGIPLNEVVFGKKISTVFYKFNWRRVEIGISWLILGGAVDFDGIETATYREKVLFYLAGPVVNLVIALIPMIIVFGPGTAFWLVGVVVKSVLVALGWLATGSVSLSTLLGPAGAVIFLGEMTQVYGNLFVWMLLNLSVMTYNMLPIPALDGGNIFTETIVKIVGVKAKGPAAIVNRVFFRVVLIVVLISMSMDFW